MKNYVVAAAAALIVASAGAALADDLPTFERDGFPMTLHQTQTLGPEGVHEQPPASTLTLDGMPASPHQLLVLKPRDKGAQ
jgi:hypothetical protein